MYFKKYTFKDWGRFNLFYENIKLKTNSNVLNSKQTILLCMKGNKEIPIMQSKGTIYKELLEKEASEIASFLKVPLKEYK